MKSGEAGISPKLEAVFFGNSSSQVLYMIVVSGGHFLCLDIFHNDRRVSAYVIINVFFVCILYVYIDVLQI